MIGERYGRLVVTAKCLEYTKWECLCDCGTIKEVRRDALIHGRQVSCGCFHKEKTTTHGESKTRLYNVHKSLLQRCTLPSAGAYPQYGAKGITVYPKWADYKTFRDWSLANGYDDTLSIDRIDGRKGYYPDNCRWVSHSVQGRNKSKKSGTSSKYIGVSFRKNRKTKCWNASVKVNDIIKTKSFLTEIEAAEWRDSICREYNLIGTVFNF